MFSNVFKPFRLKILSPSICKLSQFRSYSKCEPTIPTNIKISRVGSASDYKIISKFLLDHFFAQEPMGRALGVVVDKEVREWFPKYIKAQFVKSPPVSSQAVDQTTGKVVGVNFAVVADSQKRSRSLMDYLNPESQPIQYEISSVTESIQEGLNAAELLGIKSLSSNDDSMVLDNLMISVHEDYFSKGISCELIKKTEESARKVKNCLVAKIVTTNEYGYKAYLKRRYQVVREIKYTEYKNAEGILIFEGKSPEFVNKNKIRFMIKDLSVKEKVEK